MRKTLAILCIITICITGSAKITYDYITYGYGVLGDAISVVDALFPANLFHSNAPTTVYTRGTSQPPFGTNFGYFTGTLNGVPYDRYDTLRYLFERHSRFIPDYDNQTYFPFPVNDYENPYHIFDGYSILSVDWYPTVYRIRGDFGEVNNDTGRSDLDALKVVVNYVARAGATNIFNGVAYTETFYFIISGFPRFYDTETLTYYYADVFKGTDVTGAFYASRYNDLSYKLPFTLRSIRDTGTTLSDYMEDLLND